MFKVTPNPPDADPTSSYDKAADRALDFYLNPKPSESEINPPFDQLFAVVNGIETEVLLANLSETLASANAMVSDLAFELNGSRRHVALGIQQLIELGALLANRALDNVEHR
ncbi:MULTISPECIES: DUF6124 family protein [unclassified Pseudomonas]|uniref:DUF6124 family protein n=1 Tax=unclassified Pseudomonas TaxID=196821 RepID=UPI00119A712F|nr:MULTISPECIES: DUF6124 family protein [unclassified Pseudomonas]TWC16124.1 hypothetical protein FBY00_11219 [Pseudomonas sp. SJZ075]TWC21698.1 hypothetical protein FBX99_10619 [Pseudomonas sp. SJZ074]TWC32250.1 hypothetical protein FBY02_112108 [Pseudomonas sp. SJZ078]TWC39428.1 hypothetical protein FBY06_106182 [Pseudomonas sp. SJZ085]TWC53247.1 hypothetical protein FBY11_11219 [Pseudomonas sp. SJZ124]